jgi:hypothetical protein
LLPVECLLSLRLLGVLSSLDRERLGDWRVVAVPRLRLHRRAIPLRLLLLLWYGLLRAVVGMLRLTGDGRTVRASSDRRPRLLWVLVRPVCLPSLLLRCSLARLKVVCVSGTGTVAVVCVRGGCSGSCGVGGGTDSLRLGLGIRIGLASCLNVISQSPSPRHLKLS